MNSHALIPPVPAPAQPTGDQLTRPRRIAALDVLRGVALCGIIVVNLPPMFGLNSVDGSGDTLGFYAASQDFVQGRFFPIFSILFGIGFGIMWHSARRRSPRPRLALLRRFLFLGVLGALHMLLQPGEALLPYAIAALVVLLPSTWLPARVLPAITSGLGALLLIAGVATGGGMAIIPGLFLLGFAIGYTGFVRTALAHPGRLALVGVLAAAVTVTGFLTTDYLTRQLDQWITAGLGITMALCYVIVVMLLMRTPAEAVLRAVFAPLGRMALTNYIGATLLLVGVRALVPDLAALDSEGGYVAAAVVCAAILIVQIIASALWLRFFSQGPLERLWRIVTWGPSRAER
ncbi:MULTISPECIES: DUF418 domain-containing protein [unclassified Brevibacterium]|uniref:DUF418 domain-containing protein n=1 Tax=unclassified Brevibacterium TaxID=2614124 RepID=UPI0010F726E3|nr:MULTISPECIES: DUF418 domain-containing protein [unclassified Brevibacterium]MCM1014100.1 DUF418 domain-containing protein [Brevibacterium sp. XM4083]